MLPEKYVYFVGCLLFFIPWSILFYARKDLRREMLIMGLIASFFSLITAYFWTVDWWHPQTITGTRIGIEDALLGFSNGGIAAVLYEEVFHKRLYKRGKQHGGFAFLLIFGTFLFFILLFMFFHLSSFMASSLSLVVASIILIVKRRDLIISSVVNSILMIIVALPVYYLLMYISPGFVKHVYYLNKLSGIRITGIPIEELIFYGIFGFLVTTLYEFWYGERIWNRPEKSSQRIRK